MLRWLPLLLVGCASTRTATPPPAAPSAAEAAPASPHGAALGVEDPELQSLLEEHWETLMQRYPTWATALGDHRYDDQLADPSAAAVAELRQLQRGWLEAATALPTQAMTTADQLNRDLFVEQLLAGQRASVCRFELWSTSPRDNVLSDINYLPELHRLQTEEDGGNLLARYRAAPAVVDATLDNLRAGLADGLVANRTSLERLVTMLDNQLEAPLDEWVLLSPTKAERAGWSDEGRERFDAELREVVEQQLVPALTAYRDALRDEVLPTGRSDDRPGLASLELETPEGPLGQACYEALVQRYTTLPLVAEDLHRMGLDELESIHAEMKDLGARTLGTGELPALFARLRDDPELRFATSEEVQDKAEAALARASAALEPYFGRLPEADCVVTPVPEYEAPFTTIAYYRRPGPDRPGTYYVNTYAPETRPRFEAEVLAYHESIPGHHLQLAIAQELPELPAFRRHGGATVFVEGWGLYSERLADEMGLYSGDLDRLGVLSFDSWRAARLVVDTGLHHYGWSRQQAIDFLRDNTPLALNNIDNEVDRYITSPGQALAYKTGQIEIRRLRQEAEARLGERFDLPGFHDAVLSGGSVSLPVLRTQVEDWVLERNAARIEAEER